jgi:hypothetical protein
MTGGFPMGFNNSILEINQSGVNRSVERKIRNTAPEDVSWGGLL